MRDYAEYFIDRKRPEKSGVAVQKNIDWWLDACLDNIGKMLFVVLLAVVALSVKSFWKVGNSQAHFPIQGITISGSTLITTPQDITAAVNNVTHSSFLSADLNKISAAIETLPWISSATVTRQWPNQLNVVIAERDVRYRWGDNELLDSQGQRFDNNDQELFTILPMIHGSNGTEHKVMDSYALLLKHLGSYASTLDIKKFVYNEFLSWELHLDSGTVVTFGRNHFERRVQRFAQALRAHKIPQIDTLEKIDLRYKRGFSVLWKEAFKPSSMQASIMTATTEI